MRNVVACAMRCLTEFEALTAPHVFDEVACCGKYWRCIMSMAKLATKVFVADVGIKPILIKET